jgi:uncharacterized membrane protein YesL
VGGRINGIRRRDEDLPVRFLGLIWRGIRDVFEQMIFMAGLSLGWWLAVVPAAFGVLLFLSAPILFPLILPLSVLIPPATVTLFAMADPRRLVSRPEFSEIRATFVSSFRRSWVIGLATVPAILILAWNIGYFYGASSFLAAFVPLWTIMLVFIFILMLYMYSLAGTMESGLRNAFRGGMFVLVSRPFTAMFLSILIIAVGAVLTVMVVPMMLLGPALMAAVVNRFVLHTLEVEIIDPNAPTNERAYERERGLNPEPTVWERIKRGGRA